MERRSFFGVLLGLVTGVTLGPVHFRKTWKGRPLRTESERLEMSAPPYPSECFTITTNNNPSITFKDIHMRPATWRGRRFLTEEEAARTDFPYPREPQWENG